MWRQALRLTHHRSLRWTPSRRLSGLSSTWNISSPAEDASSPKPQAIITRQFSRPPRGTVEDADEELKRVEAERLRTKIPSATDMEFFSLGDDSLYNDDDDDDDDMDDDDDKKSVADAAYQRKQEEIRRELDSRTGRGWTDPWQISEEQWMSLQTADDLPDWSPEYVSRISQERVKLHPDGIPTLSVLASMSLPPEASPHPGLGQAKDYAEYRKEYHYNYIAGRVLAIAQPKVERIVTLKTWEEKQDAVDELFESVEEQIRKEEVILGLQPQFPGWVTKALEDFLTKVQNGELKPSTKKVDAIANDAAAEPIFMDCYDDKEPDEMVPSILSPLKPHPRDGPGRMVEEWQLAAHKKTKRILVRPVTRTIAKTLLEKESSRIFVHGRRGVGKTAVLASIVASSRKSGYVVMYLPDGDRLRKNGFFVTPNLARDGMYDLQDLSQEACAAFLASHGQDIADMEADKATMGKFFKDTQLSKVEGYSGEGMGLVDLLKHAAERKPNAPMCFSAVVDTLMNQTEKPFLMVLDEFNCYYDRGHYFHMSYDEEVREAIPYDRINLFEHALGAMALSTDIEDENTTAPKLMKKGAIIVGVTDSRCVPRKVTEGLTAVAESQAVSDDTLTVVEVPRFSDLEVDHILANFESIGLGNLRLDRGDTLMNDQEVAYLKMVSGAIGQELLDASVL